MENDINEYLDILEEKGQNGLSSVEFSIPKGTPLDEVVKDLLALERAVKSAKPFLFGDATFDPSMSADEIIEAKRSLERQLIDSVEMARFIEMVKNYESDNVRVILRPGEGKVAMFRALAAACAEAPLLARPN